MAAATKAGWKTYRNSLLHGLVDRGPFIVSDAAEFVDAANTLVGQDQRTSLQGELTSLAVADGGAREAGRGGTGARRHDASGT